MALRNLVGISVALAAITSSAQAAHPRRRLGHPSGGGSKRSRYDREITTFSEDGRLLQVEYGVEASLRGSTIVALRTQSGICWVVPQSSFGKVHRLDDHMWLLSAGLSGDARLLSEHLRRTCQSHRLSYGEAPTTKQIAQAAGELQHTLTYTAGARPLGCTAMVLGIDAPFSDSGLGKSCLYQTDPGGVVQECAFYAEGKQAGFGGKDGNQIARILPDLTAGKLNDNIITRSWWFSNNNKRNEKKNGKNIERKVAGSTETEDSEAVEGAAKEPDELSKLAASIAEQVLKIEDRNQDPDASLPTVDVWIIRPDRRRRGGQHAICYQNIDRDCLVQITNNEVYNNNIGT